MSAIETEKMTKDRGEWTYLEGSFCYMNGCVQQKWQNTTTGVEVKYWANVDGNGPQKKTLDKYAKWKQ